MFLLFISSGGPQSSQVSKWVDEQFDEAYNISQIAGDLPHVRWGRINYADVTYLTTRWGIWKYVLVFLRCWFLSVHDADRTLVTYP